MLKKCFTILVGEVCVCFIDLYYTVHNSAIVHLCIVYLYLYHTRWSSQWAINGRLTKMYILRSSPIDACVLGEGNHMGVVGIDECAFRRC